MSYRPRSKVNNVDGIDVWRCWSPSRLDGPQHIRTKHLRRGPSVDHDHDHDHDNDLFNRGLQFDMATLLQRRRVLGLIAGVGAGVAGLATAGPALAGTTGESAAAAQAAAC